MLSVSTLSVNNDTYLTNHSGQNPAANLGGLEELRIYKDSGEVYRTIVQGDVGSLPSGATINSATLGLFHTGGFSFDSVPMTVTLYALNKAWVEGAGVLDSVAGNGASWLNAAAGDPWATAGGDLGAAIATVTLPKADLAGWIQFDITSAVASWASGTANNGLAIVISSGGSYTQYTFASSEAADASLRPQLTVDYTEPVVPPTNCDHRSPVAVFILSHVPGGSRGQDHSWNNLSGSEKRDVAHQLRDIANERGHGPAVNDDEGLASGLGTGAQGHGLGGIRRRS